MNGSITCKNVKTHNLKSLDIEIPLGKWTVVTGVSGSGKTSLAFDTIFAESQRRFVETLGTYERQFLEGLPEPQADEIENLPPAVALKQTNRQSDPRAVVASAADISLPLRTVFASYLEKLCIHCGAQVNIAKPNHLLQIMETAIPKTSAFYLCLMAHMPKGERKSLCMSLRQEGYFRIFDRGLVKEIEELPADFSGDFYLILDRISPDIDHDELKNRTETAWSQVRFSTRFQTLILLMENKNADIESHSFQTQPFCAACNKPSKLVQESDLDWESTLGQCAQCHGIGNLPALDENRIVPNPQLSVAEGAIKPWSSKTYTHFNAAMLKELERKKIDVYLPWKDMPAAAKDFVWGRTEDSIDSEDFCTLQQFFGWLEKERYKPSSRVLLAKYRNYIECPTCKGERLAQLGRAATISGKRFPELMQMEIRDALDWLISVRNNLPSQSSPSIVATQILWHEVKSKLEILIDLGLGSCSLWRRCKTLSGGEFQRVLLSRVVGNGLTDALYVLDEPSVGLGQTELPGLVKTVEKLRDAGNTVLMVEHDPQLIGCADHVIELGPGGGIKGGYLLPLGKGDLPESAKTQHKNSKKIKQKSSKTFCHIHKFSAINCNDLNVDIPLETLTVIHGPSGSGKSTLLTYGISAALERYFDFGELHNTRGDPDRKIGTWTNMQIPKSILNTSELVLIEQKAAQRSITSVPATMLGIMDHLRTAFAQTDYARAADLSAADFSFNSSGACPLCEGRGLIADDLFFLGEVERTCPACGGTRYRAASLAATLAHKTIDDWLNLSLESCLEFSFWPERVKLALSNARNLGVGYLPMGMPTSQMSGGETQRLRIAAAISKGKKKLICLLDEPTRGLSEADIEALCETFAQLIADGHTLVVAEHHPRIIALAGHHIVLGPGGGREGGRIIYQGDDHYA